MSWHALEKILPITVVVAISLFIIREVLESGRRKKASARQKSAYRILLAEEIEKNNWSIYIFRKFFKAIKNNISNEMNEDYEIKYENTTERFVQNHQNGKLKESMPIPVAHREIYDRILIDIAVNDQRLFEFARLTYELISDLEHIRNSLIIFVKRSSEYRFEYLDNLSDFALKRISMLEISMNTLYIECTQKELNYRRIR